MAKNWKVGEAVKAIKDGDKQAITDIARRFPLFAVKAAMVNDAAVELLDAVPEFITARKMEAVLKSGLSATTSDLDEDEEVEAEEGEEAPKRGRKPKKKDEEEVKETKKRGRKPKKVVEEEEEAEEDEDDDEEEDDDFDFD